jgi:DNA-binding Xre family transcriptional regulator
MKDPLSIQNQKSARNLIDRAALALQASILIRYGNPQVQQLSLLDTLCGVLCATVERY